MSSPPVRDFAVSPASIKAYSGTYLLSYNNAGCLMAIFDYLLIVFVTLASAHAYYYFVLSKSMPPFATYFGIASIFAFIFIIVRYSQHGYYFSSLMQFRIITSVLPWVAGLFVCSMILFLFKSGAYFSRGSLAISAILGFIGLNIGRYFSAYLLNALVVTGKISAPRAVTIAAPRQFDHLSKTEVFQKWGVHELARFYLTEKNNELSTVDRALKFCRDNDIQCILLALEWTNSRQRERISTRLLSSSDSCLTHPRRICWTAAGERSQQSRLGFSY